MTAGGGVGGEIFKNVLYNLPSNLLKYLMVRYAIYARTENTNSKSKRFNVCQNINPIEGERFIIFQDFV
jgi:hypothetical protein